MTAWSQLLSDHKLKADKKCFVYKISRINQKSVTFIAVTSSAHFVYKAWLVSVNNIFLNSCRNSICIGGKQNS